MEPGLDERVVRRVVGGDVDLELLVLVIEPDGVALGRRAEVQCTHVQHSRVIGIVTEGDEVPRVRVELAGVQVRDSAGRGVVEADDVLAQGVDLLALRVGRGANLEDVDGVTRRVRLQGHDLVLPDEERTVVRLAVDGWLGVDVGEQVRPRNRLVEEVTCRDSVGGESSRACFERNEVLLLARGDELGVTGLAHLLLYFVVGLVVNRARHVQPLDGVCRNKGQSELDDRVVSENLAITVGEPDLVADAVDGHVARVDVEVLGAVDDTGTGK